MTLRDYQEEAVRFLLPRSRAFIKAPAGSGKTIIAASAAARKVLPGQRVLWLANTKEQVEQGIAAIKTVPGPQGVEFEVCCVASDPDSSRADLVIFDECHHLPAETWAKIYGRVKPGAVVWGFTATPWHKDEERNTALREAFPEVFDVARTRVEASGHLIKGKVFVHDLDTPGQFDPAIDAATAVEVEKRFRQYPILWDVPKVKGLTMRIKGIVTRMKSKVASTETIRAAALGKLTRDNLQALGILQEVEEAAQLSRDRDEVVKKEHEKRAKWQITQDTIQANEARNSAATRIAACENEAGESVLVLVHSIAHGELLADRIPKARLVHSKLGVRERRGAIADFRSGDLRTLVATSLADEGLDVPRASRLILVAGGRSSGKLEQRAGRVLRTFVGKDSGIIHDFLDRGALFAYAQAKARMRVYDELGYEPEIISYHRG